MNIEIKDNTIKGIEMPSEKTKKPFTLDDAKTCIPYPKESSPYRAFSGMCNCWYIKAKQSGLSDEDAAYQVLDMIAA